MITITSASDTFLNPEEIMLTSANTTPWQPFDIQQSIQATLTSDNSQRSPHPQKQSYHSTSEINKSYASAASMQDIVPQNTEPRHGTQHNTTKPHIYQRYDSAYPFQITPN
jgi:hypothetical protein